MKLVTQSFGAENEYKRAVFAIWSFYAHASASINDPAVLLFTDNPDYFKAYLKDLPVEYQLLSPQRIKIMRGEIDFLHRMKISIIEQALLLTRDFIFYFDSDVFFISDPQKEIEHFSPQLAYMHKAEYAFESMAEMPLPAGRSFRAFLDMIKKNTFEITNGPLKIFPNQLSWNAGAIVLHASHIKFLKDIYMLTDQFFPGTHNHASEQYAFSIILQNNLELKPLDEVLYHYWYNVKKKIIDIFLSKYLTLEWSKLPFERKKDLVLKWTKILPKQFSKNLLAVKDNAVQAFNADKFRLGYRYAFEYIGRSPWDLKFIKDTLYHTKRFLNKKNERSD